MSEQEKQEKPECTKCDGEGVVYDTCYECDGRGETEEDCRRCDGTGDEPEKEVEEKGGEG